MAAWEVNIYMPLYEYHCGKCNEEFETLVSFSRSDDPVKCPKCGSEETDRLMSTFSATASGGKASASCSPAGST